MTADRKKKKMDFFDYEMAKNLRRAMDVNDWNQEEMAEKYGCEQSYVSQLITGARGFGFETRGKLAKAFGVDIKGLWEILTGMTSEDKEILGEKIAELEASSKGVILNRIVDILRGGSAEAVATLRALSKVLEQTIQAGEGTATPPPDMD